MVYLLTELRLCLLFLISSSVALDDDDNEFDEESHGCCLICSRVNLLLIFLLRHPVNMSKLVLYC